MDGIEQTLFFLNAHIFCNLRCECDKVFPNSVGTIFINTKERITIFK